MALTRQPRQHPNRPRQTELGWQDALKQLALTVGLVLLGLGGYWLFDYGMGFDRFDHLFLSSCGFIAMLIGGFGAALSSAELYRYYLYADE